MALTSCLYCGRCDTCHNITNKPLTCPQYLKLFNTDAARLISIQTFMRNSGTRYRDNPKKWTLLAIKRLKLRKDFNAFFWKYQGGELYFRPKKITKKWEKFFYEKT